MTDFEKITSFESLYKAYRRAKRGKGYRQSSAKFNSMALDGINRLKDLLETRQYTIGEYTEFKVYEPKERLIKAGKFQDKIVQHSLCDNVLCPKLSEVFIRNNFAGQKGKGTLFGINALKQDMLDYNLKHGESGYILKGDVTKFFYTIDHDILKHILRNYFDDEGILWLCDLIIDSTEGKGLPLGNQSSQVFALLYLHSLDTLITDKLGIEYYGRYMDDFYLIHQSKDYLKHCIKVIEGHIDELNLSLNGKTQIMPIRNGIKFLGFHTYVSHGKTVTRIRNENKRNAFRKYKKMAQLVAVGKISLEKFEQCYSSWKSHARFGDCDGLINDFDKQIAQILEKEGVTDER